MGKVTGNEFPSDPPAKSLPFFGLTGEQRKIAIQNAKALLENEECLERYLALNGKPRAEVLAQLQAMAADTK